MAIPIAGDDKEALALASKLIRDAGFDPVIIGSLESAKLFAQGGPLYGQQITAKEMQLRSEDTSIEEKKSKGSGLTLRLTIFLLGRARKLSRSSSPAVPRRQAPVHLNTQGGVFVLICRCCLLP